MAELSPLCDWGRTWPSRSRMQGEAFGRAKGETEDAELRRATGVIQTCGGDSSAI
jgi:hypothetical protein